jgi:CDP-diacylglycerol--glycerol-3-phosphate 3-phosphatidyltransferase
MLSSLPNILTLSRIFAVPLLLLLMWDAGWLGYSLAFALFCIAGITDYFDGYLARANGAVSRLGIFLDPIADKIMVAAVIVMLVFIDNIVGVHIIAAMIILLWRAVHSPFGTALQAIRMNETRARFVGYDVWLTKWAVVTLSGAFAGLAGGLMAASQESAYPDVMSVHSSGFIVMATLIGGGTVSFWGPVWGALVFVVARDLLGALTETWLLWYGLLFMGVVLFQPEGIAGAFQHYRAKLVGRARPRPPTAPAKLTPEAENGSV